MMNSESLTHFNQFNSAKVKTIFRKSQTQFREKLGKLRLRQKMVFLFKKPV